MLQDLRSSIRIRSDKQKLETVQATRHICLSPEQTTHYDNIVVCINAADRLALQTLLDTTEIPALPLHAWHEVANYARLMLEQDANESDGNDAAIQEAFWHLGVDKHRRPLDFPREEGERIQFTRLHETAGIEEAQRMMEEYVSTNRIMRTRLEDQVKGVPRASAALVKTNLWSIDARAVEEMELTIREEDHIRVEHAAWSAVKEGEGDGVQGMKQDQSAEGGKGQVLEATITRRSSI